MFDKLPLVLDIIPSNTIDDKAGYPIELGVAMNGNGLTFAKLVRPATCWTEWNEESERLHGCSRQKLITDGEPARKIAKELNQLFPNQTLYSEHWQRDQRHLDRLYEVAGIVPQLKVECIKRILNKTQSKAWSSSRRRVLELTGLSPRRADTSALITRSTYLYSLAPQTFESRFAFKRDSDYQQNMTAA
ncbi:hypothetical protein FT643_09165 [Ketobacter sp. MCCC 1A13808]|uniref:hypothetical protein n=1 Tax=Ketobacter sp. MCCC 1A13808 TaxID=2602738 RepID=UPI000F25BD1F|nr:hypothetical protein [Ketobacter sp. MCCC 1A13808]MVF12315.1 hypothetical protein [Ketobacter sp. MCCC 1A13808]RLP52481.1 MAG: hypothetical protein D6160_20775 [Ketobacter sp.]